MDATGRLVGVHSPNTMLGSLVTSEHKLASNKSVEETPVNRPYKAAATPAGVVLRPGPTALLLGAAS